MAKKKGPYVEIIGKWKHECVSPSRRYDTNLETGEVIIADTFCTWEDWEDWDDWFDSMEDVESTKEDEQADEQFSNNT